jgi:hypothetical protein
MKGIHPKLNWQKEQIKYKHNMEYNRIKQLVLDKDYKFFNGGDYDLNFIWERTSDTFTNYFTDKLHILYTVDNIEKIITLPATTKAGLYGKNTVTNPITVIGITGTAIIIPDQYLSSWKFNTGNGTGTLPWGYPYFQQIRGIKYWRDADKDKVIDYVGEQDNKVFGTNWHIMKEPINNWSIGCMGISYDDMLTKVVPITKEAITRWGDIFSGTIIKTDGNI